jgi:hypothetical protein
MMTLPRWVEHHNQPTIVKVSGHMRTQRARELAGVGEHGEVGRGGGREGGYEVNPINKVSRETQQ